MNTKIILFRYGHRLERDKRITTHCGLVARAFGAEKMIYSGQEDPNIINNVSSINKRFGSDFEVEYIRNWRRKLDELKKDYIIVHLTMYGLALNDFVTEITKREDLKKGIVLVVGSQKVPTEVYDIADYNISVTNQPHSEVAALAIVLDRLNPKYLTKTFEKKRFGDGRVSITPSNRRKMVKDKLKE
jgi:tRNA (cytidine56-2'-O)-methyltransferase